MSGELLTAPPDLPQTGQVAGEGAQGLKQTVTRLTSQLQTLDPPPDL